jgi:hypothetical protein
MHLGFLTHLLFVLNDLLQNNFQVVIGEVVVIWSNMVYTKAILMNGRVPEELSVKRLTYKASVLFTGKSGTSGGVISHYKCSYMSMRPILEIKT